MRTITALNNRARIGKAPGCPQERLLRQNPPFLRLHNRLTYELGSNRSSHDTNQSCDDYHLRISGDSLTETEQRDHYCWDMRKIQHSFTSFGSIGKRFLRIGRQ
jgi:hypothetical protein